MGKAKDKTTLKGSPRKDVFMLAPDVLVLIEDPAHPLYDERVKLPVDEALVKSIMVHGVIEPVVVRKNGEELEVVAGRQRTKAAREANLRLERDGKEPVLVPCTVRRGEDRDLFGVMVSENAIRQGDSPLVESAKAQRLVNMGASDEYVATSFGWSLAVLKARLALLDLDGSVKRAVESGKVSPTAAAQLSKLTREKQREKLAELVAPGVPKVSVKRAKAAALGKVNLRPSLKQIKAARENAPLDMVKLTLDWVIGEVSDEEFAKAMRTLGGALPGQHEEEASALA